MNENQEYRFEVDLWGKMKDVQPPHRREIQLACVHEVDSEIDSFVEPLFFRRLDDGTELWCMPDRVAPKGFDPLEGFGPESDRPEDVCQGLRRVVVDHQPPKNDHQACKELLKVRVEAGVGFEWPNRFHVDGILSASDHKEVVDQIRAKIEAVREQAAQFRSSPIIQAATGLGLNPEPTSWNSDSWWCHCPGTNHRLAIVASTGEFGCGYCGVKGGIDELRAFAEQRRKPNA